MKVVCTPDQGVKRKREGCKTRKGRRQRVLYVRNPIKEKTGTGCA